MVRIHTYVCRNQHTVTLLMQWQCMIRVWISDKSCSMRPFRVGPALHVPVRPSGTNQGGHWGNCPIVASSLSDLVRFSRGSLKQSTATKSSGTKAEIHNVVLETTLAALYIMVFFLPQPLVSVKPSHIYYTWVLCMWMCVLFSCVHVFHALVLLLLRLLAYHSHQYMNYRHL